MNSYSLGLFGSLAPGSRSSQATTSLMTVDRLRAPYTSPSWSHRSSLMRTLRTGVWSSFGDGTPPSVGACPYAAQPMIVNTTYPCPYKNRAPRGCVSIHRAGSVSIHEQTFTGRKGPT